MCTMIAFKLIVENFRVFHHEESAENNGEKLEDVQSQKEILSNKLNYNE